MSHRMLEETLGTTAVNSMKSACKSCEKRYLCHRIADVIEDIQKTEMLVWDLDHQIRYRSLMREMTRLGYAFPEGYSFCDISKMSRKEITDLLREAQELLIEMRVVGCDPEDKLEKVP